MSIFGDILSKIFASRSLRADKLLNWQTSLVDLMTLIEMNSSMRARKTLAGELHYSGDTNA